MDPLDPMAAIKVTFFQECEEQLAELESGLLAMQAGDNDPETVNAVFRAVHSIKGGAGAFSLDALVRFAHVFETTLDLLRSGRLAIREELMMAMLRASDMLADHVRAAQDGGAVDEEHSRTIAAALTALNSGPDGDAADAQGEASGHGSDGSGIDLGDFDFQPVSAGFDMDAFQPLSVDPLVEPLAGLPEIPVEPVSTGNHFTIFFKPLPSLYALANEPAVLLREVGRLGTMNAVLDAALLPPLQDLDPEGTYLAWTITLETEQGEDAIQEVFEFVDGDCELTVTNNKMPTQSLVVEESEEVASALALAAADDNSFLAVLAAAQAAVAKEASVAAIPSSTPIAAKGSGDHADPAAARSDETGKVVSLDDSRREAAPRNAEPRAAEPRAVEPRAVEPRQAEPGVPAAAAGQTIRVDLERVDRLINLVGELVINQAMLTQRVSDSDLMRVNGVSSGLDELEQLTREIQDSVMAIRAQPVKSVFQRMPRLAREVAAATNKKVHLITDGENTEVDKSVIERLSDPLTHMIRNAIDHGLETPDKRIAAGKSPEGTVKLSAAHRSGRVVIEVADDGAGINRPRVKAIAIEKGLIAADATLSDEEIDNLIFLPGFSTAAEVSDISGRGVGMDVVKRSIQALGGRISITSRPGRGSVFTLSLPLTLAVLDGMVVTVCDQTMVIPLTAIIETLQPKASTVRMIGTDAALIAIRDSYVPLIDVGSVMGYRGAPAKPNEGVALLVEGEDGRRTALVVDAIQGQRQVVIKSLEANYRSVGGIAAATILGDGRVALILDVDAIVARREDPDSHEFLMAG